jgi:hypothetical protein
MHITAYVPDDLAGTRGNSSREMRGTAERPIVLAG